MPKREDDFWASQKEGLRYCSKHKRYYWEDLGCQLCWLEESSFDREVKDNPPKLGICPNCHKLSLFLNNSTNLYECLNTKCKRRFTRDELQSLKIQVTALTEKAEEKPSVTQKIAEASNLAQQLLEQNEEKHVLIKAKIEYVKSLEPSERIRCSTIGVVKTPFVPKIEEYLNVYPEISYKTINISPQKSLIFISDANRRKWINALFLVFEVKDISKILLSVDNETGAPGGGFTVHSASLRAQFGGSRSLGTKPCTKCAALSVGIISFERYEERAREGV